jgi:hypothetical protein
MSESPIACSNVHAIRQISEDLGVDINVVDMIVKAYISKVKVAFRAEMPFMMNGLGKFHFKYVNRPKFLMQDASYYRDKIHREIAFTANDELKAEFVGWVKNFGAKDNHTVTLTNLKIRPDEFGKMIKKQILDDQRSLGFRSELLFDEIPESEKALSKELGEAPTSSEIVRRLGLFLNDGK